MGDDGSNGTATTYDLRYSTSPINAANFATATAVVSNCFSLSTEHGPAMT